MLRDLLLYLKYPAVAGIIGVVWLGSAVFIIADPTLPVAKMILINMVCTIIIGLVGFRVEKD